MSERIATAKFKLSYERDYLSTAIWRLIPVPKPGIGTLAVDQYWRLYYDPDVVNDETKWTMTELTSVLYHEICHLLRSHNERGEGHDRFVWNLAADAEINDDIEDEGQPWKLPDGCVTADKFDKIVGKAAPRGLLAEPYYKHLMDNADKITIKEGDGEAGSGNCGSAAHGQSQEGDGEDGPPKDGAGETGGIGKAEGDLLKRQVAQEVQEAAGRGEVPNHLKRWADDKLTQRVNWRTAFKAELRRVIAAKAGANDYTYRRLSRRSNGDIILPSTHQPIPQVAAIIDTSGSMSQEQVSQCVEEIAGMLKTGVSDTGLTVLSVDADVHEMKRVFKKDSIVPIGGGGTDMRIGIEAVAKLKPKVDICVVLTDGETPWPEHPINNMKLIVCLIPNPRLKAYASHYGWQVPDWAKVIEIQF